MKDTQDARDRLVLRCSTPLFRPFFLGGLGLLGLGVALLVVGPVLGRSTVGPPGGGVPLAGLGAFLSTFGFFVAIIPLVGRMPYRREVVVDPAAGRLVRRDRTLVRLRQESFAFIEIRGVEVEEARHVDGDPDFTLALRLDSGRSVPLDRFTDRLAAADAARLLRDHLPTADRPATAPPSPH